MRFSIVTPNYNYGRFLKKALESVLAQVNDAASGGASSPSEPQLGRDAAAKKSRYSFQYISEPDQGQTDAINKGLRRATGDIVAWLNADEWYLPGKLALVAAAFAKHPDADFVYGEPLFVDKDGNPIRIRRAHRFSKFVLYGCCCYIASCASFWRRRILDDGFYLDPSYKVIMDGEYYCRLAKAGYRFRFLPATIAAFTWHDSNVSSVLADRREVEWRQIRVQFPAREFAHERNHGECRTQKRRAGSSQDGALLLRDEWNPVFAVRGFPDRRRPPQRIHSVGR